MMTKDIDQLRADARKAQEQIRRIEEAERVRANQALVGRSFKYRNCYSCPEKPSDYWWLYLRVLRVSASGVLVCHEFQIDRDDKIAVDFGRDIYLRLTDGYREIRNVEFDRAWSALVARVNAGVPARPAPKKRRPR